MNKQSTLITLGVLWILCIVVGFRILWDYSSTPGPQGNAPLQWPSSSRLHFPGTISKLVVFAHPRCPCSRASLGELEKINGTTRDQLSIDIVFYHPPKFSTQWVKSDLWAKAQHIPNTTLTIDSHQYEISLFHPQTSGQVYLYSPQGKLLYSGGITPERGQEGENRGAEGIVAWVLEKKIMATDGQVFGCTLFHDGALHQDQQTLGEINAYARRK